MIVGTDRRAFIWLIGLLVSLAWVVLWVWGRSPYGRFLHHGQMGAIGSDGSIATVFLPLTLYLID